MAEETIVAPPPAEENNGTVTIQTSPFGNAWSETPPAPKIETPAAVPPAATPAAVVTPPPSQSGDEEILDPKDWLKREFGVDDIAILKAEREELTKLKSTPATTQIETIPEEIEEKFFEYVATKKQFDKIEKANLENPKDAADLIKTFYKFKYPDFNDSDIKEHFDEQYAKVPVPKQADDQTNDEYAEVLEQVKARNEAIDRKIIRDAKVVKPEFTEFKSKIVRPELPKYQPKPEAPSQESLAKIEEQRQNFLNKLESDYAKFDGFSTTVKDESVEIPVAFKVPDEAKTAIKERFKAGFDLNEFIDKRWSDAKGEAQINQLISDVYVLENLDKILLGVANNAANQRLVEYRKQAGNINVNGKTPQQTFEQNNNNGNVVSPFAKNAWSETPPPRNN